MFMMPLRGGTSSQCGMDIVPASAAPAALCPPYPRTRSERRDGRAARAPDAGDGAQRKDCRDGAAEQHARQHVGHVVLVVDHARGPDAPGDAQLRGRAASAPRRRGECHLASALAACQGSWHVRA